MAPLWDFDATTLPAREIACYLVSEALGFGLVPLTVWASGELGEGSAQRFVEFDLEFDPRPLFVPTINERLWPVAVLDVVCNNADRKLGHFLHEKGTGRLWAIDNGLTFHTEPKLRTVLWGLAELRLPAKTIEALEKFRTDLDGNLARRLSELLDTTEIESLAERVDDLLADPVHPSPPTDRPPVPWPVW